MSLRSALPILLATLLAACASPAPRAPAEGTGAAPARAPQAGPARGAFYLDDGPSDRAPVDPHSVPDAVPRAEPLLARANRPYEVFGRRYVPMTQLEPYQQRGVASWYGRRYHGRQTSSGEVYDMYAMTAAHPTLPLPSYVRVTHLGNGRSVVVRVNDRGPFLHDRLIDLSWTAASRLGFVQAGSAEVEVELILEPQSGATIAAVQPAQPAATAPAPPLRRQGDSMVPAQALAGQAEPPARLTVEMVATPVGEPVLAGGAAGALAPAPASASSSAMGASVRPQSGLFLQFGALSSAEGAQALRDRIAREFDWLAGRLLVQLDGSLYKVHAGPWSNRDEALAAAQRVRGASEHRPFPVSR